MTHAPTAIISSARTHPDARGGVDEAVGAALGEVERLPGQESGEGLGVVGVGEVEVQVAVVFGCVGGGG